MKVRFQADADFNQNIVRAVRRRDPAIDFQTAHDARLHGVDDEMVLARAAEEGRLVVSHDYRTMPRHFATFVTTRTSAGVIMVSQAIPLSDVVADLLLIWEASEAQEWINRLTPYHCSPRKVAPVRRMVCSACLPGCLSATALRAYTGRTAQSRKSARTYCDHARGPMAHEWECHDVRGTTGRA